MMLETVEELAYYFVHTITQAKVGIKGRINSAITSIQQLLEDGWTLDEIKYELDEFAKMYPQIVVNIYHIEEIMGQKVAPNNLIEPDVFYYHNILRNVSGPTRIKRDPETGKLIRYSEPFYLEIKKRFTLKDLLDYWYKQMEIIPNEHIVRQDEGKFKYLLSNYTLDEILFAIDVAKAIRREMQLRPLRNAFELDKYIEEARALIKEKENVHRLQGINREFKRSQLQQ